MDLFEKNPELKTARARLQTIVDSARKTELDMYSHLSSIFAFIKLPEDQCRNQARIRFSQPNNISLIIEPSDSFDHQMNKPDFSAVLGKLINAPGNRWRDRLSWCGVKVKTADCPRPINAMADPKQVVLQTTDYVHLHMTGQPFQLFSIGLFIYGNVFCVGIYNHVGVRFSPNYNIWSNLDTFIRVVRCIITNMTSHQLGQNTTVTQSTAGLRDEWFTKLQTIRLSTCSDYAPDDPVYEISLGGTTGHLDGERWVMVGSPIRVSLSLFGRGTLVWRVRNKRTSELRAMKNAWHSGARSHEADIYKLIQGEHHGVAHSDLEADVMHPGSDVAIGAAALRGSGGANSADHAVLHRVFIYPVGRPLYKARSELELIRGMRAALRGHKFLCDQSILHRDISVGNIMLSSDENPAESAEGFLMDLESALCMGPRVETRTLNPVRTPTSEVLKDTKVEYSRWDVEITKYGAPMTGTLQFMATDLLLSLSESEQASKREATNMLIEHKTHHGIESLLWIFIYSLIRRLLEAGSQNMDDQWKMWMSGLTDDLNQYFGSATPDSILAQRTEFRPGLVVRNFPSFFSAPVKCLVEKLREQFELRHRNPLTHIAVLNAFDIAIAQLTQS
ncbi:hypothetical protein OBBRIDRAFT_836099 [Obba rivulosa]|uniref:Fungal-type protein kinase domain-containing protein n=1 Tax=Obba rivulosa TaxID=1052685 RepID=A0A8E2DJ75_9APHY|nr:hypothetical protein OBBRIDRAFT_836099 [Obba rivulosa]